MAAERNAPAEGKDEDKGILAEAAARALSRIDVARRKTFEPVRVTWQKAHLGTIALSGPLLHLTAADLTGDGRDELLALAPEEAVAIARKEPGAPEVLGRAALEELELATIRPREPVGTAAIEGSPTGIEWWVRSSEHAEAAVIGWRDEGLVVLRRERGYPICRDASLELEEGRSRFAPRTEGAEPLQGARCRRDLVGPEGQPLSVFASVSVRGDLEVSAKPRCPPESGCAKERSGGAEERGYALALGDLDRDGAPDVAAAARRPPGEPDEVALWSLDESGLVPVYRAEFPGSVAGMATGDISGDGRPELVVAVRASARDRIELWVLT